MKRLLLLLYMLLLMTTGAMSQESRIEQRGIGPGRPQSKQSGFSWRRFTVKGEEFSVTLPTFPTMTTRKTFQTRLGKDRVERELNASAGGVTYSIDIFENPEPRQSLAEFIAEQNAGYDLATESTLNLSGLAGKQYSSLNKTSPATVQFFTNQDRLYRFTASGKVAEDDAVRQFFSSISFGKETAVVEVPEDPNERIFIGREVDTKARLASKPEPPYTEEALKKGISGTVVLRAVFSADAKVVNIRVVSDLPHGLTEAAIDAAKKIKFIPATKDGKPISMWMQLEYNFSP